MASGTLQAKLKPITELYKSYSLNDVLKSLFVLGSYPLNNVAQIQHNIQYEALRGLAHDKFKAEDRIKSYDDFKAFATKLDGLTPGFPMYEDYSPPIDWGNTRFYFQRQLFSIIWGVDGSTYDQLTQFRLIYTDNDERYKTKTGRSPISELKDLLDYHSDLAVNIETGLSELPDYTTPGTFEIPNKSYWQDMMSFCQTDPSFSYPSLVETHTTAVEEIFNSKFNEKAFFTSLQTGSPITGIFIDTGKSKIPMLLRYSAENLIKSWKFQFSKYHNSEGFFEENNNARKDVTMGLSAYQHEIFGEKNTHQLPVLLDVQNEKPLDDGYLVSLCFREDRILATLALSPSNDHKAIEKEIADTVPKIWKSLESFKTSSPKFYLPIQGNVCEMRPRHEAGLQVELLVVMPIQFTTPQAVKTGKIADTHFLFMEDYVAIIDSCEDEDDLLGFLDYMSSDESIVSTDTLDLFGSYKDSDSVLIPGADEPNFAVVAPTWGPSFRYNALKDFWALYPGLDILDNPRGWELKQETDTRLRMVKKSLFHSLIYAKYGDTHFLQSSPFSLQDYQIGSVTNLLMESLEDTLSRVPATFGHMPIVRYSTKIEVHFFPSSFLAQEKFKHLSHLATNGDKWNMDSGRYSKIGTGVRVVYDHDLVSKTLQEAKDNTFELDLAKAIVKELNKVSPDEASLKNTLDEIEKLKGLPRFTQYAAKKEASHPVLTNALTPTDADYKKARKVTAFAVKKVGLEPGEYIGQKAKTAINAVIVALRTEFESEVAKFSFDKSIAELVGYVDAGVAEYRYRRLAVLGSRDHDVDYERAKALAEDKKKFLIRNKNDRYLVEKFVSLSPTGAQRLGEKNARLLMAFADEIIGAYSWSDSLHYDMYHPKLVIERDYRLGIASPKDVLRQQDDFNRKQSQISLGEIGKESDRTGSEDVIVFADALDVSFNEDFGFKLSSMMAVQQVLSLWSEYTEADDSEAYEINEDRVVEVCLKHIKEISSQEVKAIISFLTLKPDEILYIIGGAVPPDIPVWEHNKRPYRYTIRPLIRKGETIIWGPYTVHLSMGIWSNVVHETELPAILDAPATLKAIQAEHEKLDKLLEAKCIEIGKRFTTHAQRVKPKHANFPTEYGDYDCLLYIPEINAFVNIEAKNINMPKVMKDAKTQIEKVFLKPEKNYVYRVEKRAEYLEAHFKDLANTFGVEISEKPNVVSLFVTTDIYFWTEFPPRKTDVNFMRVDMLNDYLESMIHPKDQG